jgi:tetratricopeptide (TPR) repeat protein
MPGISYRSTFNSLVARCAVCAAVLLSSYQLHAQFGNNRDGGLRGYLHGQVITASGPLATGTRVELRKGLGFPVSSAYVQASGTFEFRDVVPDLYQVVVISGVNEISTTVQVSTANPDLTIRIGSVQNKSEDGGTVSVAALNVPPKAQNAYQKAAELFAKNDTPGAWKQLTNALKIWPRYAAALTLRGVLRTDSNQHDEARKDFLAALEADRGYNLAYIGLATSYNGIGQFDNALKIIDESKARTAQMWQSHFEASKALLGKRSYDSALYEAGRTSTLLGRDLPTLNLIKAKAYLGLNNSESAVKELKQYLRQENEGPQADSVRRVLASLRK